MSAPCSMGRRRYGVAKVLSMTTGTPCACAALATASMSTRSAFGLPTVSMKTHFVFGRMASVNPCAPAFGSTKVTSMPQSFAVCARRL